MWIIFHLPGYIYKARMRFFLLFILSEDPTINFESRIKKNEQSINLISILGHKVLQVKVYVYEMTFLWLNFHGKNYRK